MRPERSTPRPQALPGEDSSWVSLAGPYREKGPGVGPVGSFQPCPCCLCLRLEGTDPARSFILRSALTSYNRARAGSRGRFTVPSCLSQMLSAEERVQWMCCSPRPRGPAHENAALNPLVKSGWESETLKVT